MSTELSRLSSLWITGEFGNHEAAVVVMTVVSVLMIAGPALGSLIYIYFSSLKTRRGVEPGTVQKRETAPNGHKKAA